ncbi:hypothetical protein B296_00000064 [Ensete ventricosum]|uniref:Uncharacterized protein n=1 Tax=Ensete ventricosum TaxID=4639 RepID=A0A427B604_ENSVE|nr:hypothetical protein B296_00000064 [Ensete ventricosum]
MAYGSGSGPASLNRTGYDTRLWGLLWLSPRTGGRIGISGVDRREAVMAEEKKREAGRDELAESLADLFTNISTMIKGELEVAH